MGAGDLFQDATQARSDHLADMRSAKETQYRIEAEVRAREQRAELAAKDSAQRQALAAQANVVYSAVGALAVTITFRTQLNLSSPAERAVIGIAWACWFLSLACVVIGQALPRGNEASRWSWWIGIATLLAGFLALGYLGFMRL